MELWSLKNSKILIVDDFSEMRSMMRQMVQSLGAIDIQTVKDGAEAVREMAQKSFDIVLCDYNLGSGKDGQQILEEAKHRELLADNALFIMITAENTSLMVMGAMEFYPDDYLSKPFSKPVLRARLRKLMEAQEVQKQIHKALKRKAYDEALSLCDQCLAEQNKYRYQILKIKADILLKSMRYSEAERLLQEILRERDLSWAMLNLGIVYFEDDRLQQAKEMFESLILSNDNYMAAYDWLAKTLAALGEKKESVELLKQAVSKSPKALMRQRMLGQLSKDIDDHETAEKAYKHAVEYGLNSCFRDVNDYSSLSEVQTKQGKSDKALHTVTKLRKDFRGDRSATTHGDIMECDIYMKSGQQDKAEYLIEKAYQLYNEKPELFSAEMCLSLANSCLQTGNTDQGAELLKHTVRNNHDDQTMVKRAKQVFADAGMESEGNSIIDNTCKEIADLNNKGVTLAEQGKYEESIELFVQAAKAMPDNILINLNAAQSILLLVKTGNHDASSMRRAQSFLQRARRLDEKNSKLKKLMQTFDVLNRKKA